MVAPSGRELRELVGGHLFGAGDEEAERDVVAGGVGGRSAPGVHGTGERGVVELPDLAQQLVDRFVVPVRLGECRSEPVGGEEHDVDWDGGEVDQRNAEAPRGVRLRQRVGDERIVSTGGRQWPEGVFCGRLSDEDVAVTDLGDGDRGGRCSRADKGCAVGDQFGIAARCAERLPLWGREWCRREVGSDQVPPRSVDAFGQLCQPGRQLVRRGRGELDEQSGRDVDCELRASGGRGSARCRGRRRWLPPSRRRCTAMSRRPRTVRRAGGGPNRCGRGTARST